MSPPARILAGLLVGLALGALGAARRWPMEGVLDAAGAVGGLWLDALRMTVIPLVVSLVVTGIATVASSRHMAPSARRVTALFALLLLGSALLAALLGPVLLAAWTPPPGAIEALRAGLGVGVVPPAASTAEWVRGLLPANVVAAAAEGAIVPLTIFALLLGLAAARLDPQRAAPLLGFFAGVAAAVLVIVRWILLLAPLGVFALALGVGARLGLGAGAALVHYVTVQIAITLLLGLAMYPLAVLAGGVGAGAFARAVVPAQAVAASTQSSLAALPVMLTAAQRLNLPAAAASAMLPLAVAVFRIAAPASIVIVTLAMARMNGVEVSPATLGLVVAMATLNTLVIAGLPNQVTFFAAYAPPAIAAGVPVELLPLLLAVDVIPDIFYTVSNVTADLAVTCVAAAREPSGEDGTS